MLSLARPGALRAPGEGLTGNPLFGAKSAPSARRKEKEILRIPLEKCTPAFFLPPYGRRACLPAYPSTYLFHAYIHTHIHTYRHAYIRTYIRTYTHT